MAMAAMMTSGMKDMPRYPRTRPVMAIPLPLIRPALLPISERDKCPKIIARTADGNRKKKQPKIKLATDLPLVVGNGSGVGVGGAGDATFAAGLAGAIAAPQLLQKPVPSAAG